MWRVRGVPGSRIEGCGDGGVGSGRGVRTGDQGWQGEGQEGALAGARRGARRRGASRSSSRRRPGGRRSRASAPPPPRAPNTRGPCCTALLPSSAVVVAPNGAAPAPSSSSGLRWPAAAAAWRAARRSAASHMQSSPPAPIVRLHPAAAAVLVQHCGDASVVDPPTQVALVVRSRGPSPSRRTPTARGRPSRAPTLSPRRRERRRGGTTTGWRRGAVGEAGASSSPASRTGERRREGLYSWGRRPGRSGRWERCEAELVRTT